MKSAALNVRDRVLGLLCLLAFGTCVHAAGVGDEAKALLNATAVKGGLCLVVGAQDPSLATALAEAGTCYVQVLQPDAAKAQAWGLPLAVSAQRQQIGIRQAAFNPDDYGSDLFNLIVVQDAAALGSAKLKDLNRILVPGGGVVFAKGLAASDAEAAALGMRSAAAPSFGACYTKAVTERVPQPCDNLKWRAGARAHWSGGWSRHGSANGVFYYTEKLEVAGDPKAGQFLLSVRDAYNGRLLWTLDNARVIGGTRDGRLFVLNREGRLVSCEARTGLVQYEFPADEFMKHVGSAQPAGDDLMILIGWALRGYSNDGRKLWDAGVNGPSAFAVSSNRVYVLGNDAKLGAVDTKDGKYLWKSPALGSHGGGISLSDKYVHATSWGNVIATFEPETGKELWRYTNSVPTKDWSAGIVVMRDKVHVMRYAPYGKEDSDLFITTLDSATGKVVSPETGTKRLNRTNMCAPWSQRAGDYIFYFFNIWVDPATMKSEFTYFAHPSCFFGTYLANGLAYNFPSRKFGPLQGISAIAPADIAFDHAAGGQVFQKYADAPAGGAATTDDDWVMFRGTPSRANATKASPGVQLARLWEVSLGLGTNSFGQLCSIRSGLTQAVSAYGLAIVADMEGQRIVALDVQTGRQKWVFPVGSRVEFSPTLYRGLCLFTAKDGFVYGLNARTGALCWRRMIPSRTRLIGGQDKLESLWPVTSDVMVENGIGYACAGLSSGNLGGVRAIAFRPETGELVWGQCYADGVIGSIFVGTGNTNKVFLYKSVVDTATGKLAGNRGWPGGAGSLSFNNPMDDYLAGGVSLPRNGEDRGGVQLANGIILGKTLAFDEGLSVAFLGAIAGEQWERGSLSFYAKSKRGKENLWEVKDDLIVDDIVVAPSCVYVVGHHYSTAQKPELRVVSREKGETLASYELNTAFPAWNGMSVAADKVFIATGEGRLICYGKK